MREYRNEAVEVFRLLQEYLAIHKRIFKSSIKEIGATLGIVTPVPYAELSTKLAGIQAGLNDILNNISPKKTGQSDAARALREYIESLLKTLDALHGVTSRLAENVSPGGRKYSRGDYRADVKAYNALVTAYTGLGWKVNEFFPDISESAGITPRT